MEPTDHDMPIGQHGSDSSSNLVAGWEAAMNEVIENEKSEHIATSVINRPFGQPRKKPLEPDGAPPNIIQSASVESAPLIKLDSTESDFPEDKKEDDVKMPENQTSWLDIAASSSSKGSQGSYADQVPALSGSGSAKDPFDISSLKSQEDAAVHIRAEHAFPSTPKHLYDSSTKVPPIVRQLTDETESRILPSASGESGNLDSILGPNSNKTHASVGLSDVSKHHSVASKKKSVASEQEATNLVAQGSIEEILGPNTTGGSLASLGQSGSLDEVLGPSLTEPSSTKHERSVMTMSTYGIHSEDTGSHIPKGRSRPAALYIPETMPEGPVGSEKSGSSARAPIDRIVASLDNHQKFQTRPQKVPGMGLRRPGVEQSDSEISRGRSFESGSSFQTSPSQTPVSGVSDQGSSWSESRRDQFSPGSYTENGSMSTTSRGDAFSPSSFTDGGSHSVSSGSTNPLSPNSYTDHGSQSIGSSTLNPMSPGSYSENGSRSSANPLSPGSFSDNDSRSSANPLSPGSFSENDSRSAYSTDGNPLSPGSITEDEDFRPDPRFRAQRRRGSYARDGTLTSDSSALSGTQGALSPGGSSFSQDASSFSRNVSMSQDESRRTRDLGVISETDDNMTALFRDDSLTEGPSVMTGTAFGETTVTGYPTQDEYTEQEAMSPGGNSAMTGFYTATDRSEYSLNNTATEVSESENEYIGGNPGNHMHILPEVEDKAVIKSSTSAENGKDGQGAVSPPNNMVEEDPTPPKDEPSITVTTNAPATLEDGVNVAFGSESRDSSPQPQPEVIDLTSQDVIDLTSVDVPLEDTGGIVPAEKSENDRVEASASNQEGKQEESIDKDLSDASHKDSFQPLTELKFSNAANISENNAVKPSSTEERPKVEQNGASSVDDIDPASSPLFTENDAVDTTRLSATEEMGDANEKSIKGSTDSTQNGLPLPPLAPKTEGLTLAMVVAMPPPPPPPLPVSKGTTPPPPPVSKGTPKAMAALALPPPPPPPTPPPPKKRRSVSSKSSKDSSGDSSKASRGSSKSGSSKSARSELKTPLIESKSEGLGQDQKTEVVEGTKSQITDSLMVQTRSCADTSAVLAAASTGGASEVFDKPNMVRIGDKQDEKFIFNTALAKKRVIVVQLLAFGLVGLLVGFLGSLFVQSSCHFVSVQETIGDDGKAFDLHYGLWKYSPVESAFQGYSYCYEYDDEYTQDAPRFSRISTMIALFGFTFSLINLWWYLIFGQATRILWETAIKTSLIAGVLQLSTMSIFLGPLCRFDQCAIGPAGTVSLCAAAAYFIVAFEMHYNSPIQSWIDDVPSCPSSEQPHRMVENLEMADLANSAVSYVKRLVARSPTGADLPSLNQIQRNNEDPIGEAMFERDLSQQPYKPPDLV